eukprot:6212244-Pleurochrysis_carterae.AAC.10
MGRPSPIPNWLGCPGLAEASFEMALHVHRIDQYDSGSYGQMPKLDCDLMHIIYSLTSFVLLALL